MNDFRIFRDPAFLVALTLVLALLAGFGILLVYLQR